MSLNEAELAQNTVLELIDNMGQISTLLYNFGRENGNTDMMTKAGVISVVSEILKEEDVLDFSSFLEYFVSKQIMDDMKPINAVNAMETKSSKEFKDELSAYSMFLGDMAELGEDGFNEFKERLKKNDGDIDIDDLLKSLRKK